ncbi:hydrogenase maturation protease [Granulicella aggregans]|uniref:Hydrogenase maturation protease n=1 Tax=Granulicella aggregans TaxID=474949 RepID=A0A7W8E5C4_9BACT|nr:hydrogenase maturation protease [Granulicella aggregans]MBB5059943.1 hydrogenase maturation protease [Granulicella aggregans]
MTSFGVDAQCSISVIGLGNVFLGDDGFGPLVIETFRCSYACSESVEVIDLGTPGLDLAPYLYGKELVVIVDAVHSAMAPGTISFFREEDFVSSRAKLRITGHDPGLWESLAHLRLAGRAPAELIVLGVTPESCTFAEGISERIVEIAYEASASIAQLLRDRGIACFKRVQARKPNLWWFPLTEPPSITAV